ncbi:MAG: hypothetical protein OER21_10760 [Gemmatimonadota bacterium]|nr:hypothetical protein [Gemmatimonadota bacterium]
MPRQYQLLFAPWDREGVVQNGDRAPEDAIAFILLYTAFNLPAQRGGLAMDEKKYALDDAVSLARQFRGLAYQYAAGQPNEKTTYLRDEGGTLALSEGALELLKAAWFGEPKGALGLRAQMNVSQAEDILAVDTKLGSVHEAIEGEP